MRRLTVWMGIVWMVTAVFPWTAGSQTLSGQAEWDKVVDAAKKEGEVIVWGRREYENLFIARFQKPGIGPPSAARNVPLGRFVEEWKAGLKQVGVLSGIGFINSRSNRGARFTRGYFVGRSQDEANGFRRNSVCRPGQQLFSGPRAPLFPPALAQNVVPNSPAIGTSCNRSGAARSSWAPANRRHRRGRRSCCSIKDAGADFTRSSIAKPALSRDYRQMIDWLWKGENPIHFPAPRRRSGVAPGGVSARFQLKEGAPMLAGATAYPACRIFLTARVLSTGSCRRRAKLSGKVSVFADGHWRRGLDPVTVQNGRQLLLPSPPTNGSKLRDTSPKALQALRKMGPRFRTSMIVSE